jgi:hypothetical protein
VPTSGFGIVPVRYRIYATCAMVASDLYPPHYFLLMVLLDGQSLGTLVPVRLGSVWLFGALLTNLCLAGLFGLDCCYGCGWGGVRYYGVLIGIVPGVVLLSPDCACDLLVSALSLAIHG